mmetsp:Transcript_8399/g.16743  ORF Transcript_8399/g.16743 Transcript_8399/m.16743 type:complete len:131 (-) Transcript_8399:1263-1655(-)
MSLVSQVERDSIPEDSRELTALLEENKNIIARAYQEIAEREADDGKPEDVKIYFYRLKTALDTARLTFNLRDQPQDDQYADRFNSLVDSDHWKACGEIFDSLKDLIRASTNQPNVQIPVTDQQGLFHSQR